MHLVATIESVEGMDGLQVASTAIFLDRVWSTTPMTHARDRIHRLGIKSPKHIIYLQMPGTVDMLVRKALDKKWTEQELVYHYLQEDTDDTQ